MLDLVIPSPGDAHSVMLKVVGEIRYGPRYNAVHVDRVELNGVHVGDDAEWLSSHLLAAQEWVHVAGREGPDTRLLLIDAERGVMCRGPIIARGLVEAFRLVEGRVDYRVQYYGGLPDHPEMERSFHLPQVQDWVAYK